jgi:hypothetical protein
VSTLAGEGSSGERGLRPLSKSLPLLNRIKPRVKDKPVREGDKGGEYIASNIDK